MNKQKGLALILVLWVLSLLTIMAGSFVLSIRRETATISGLKETAEAMALAESGIQLAQWMLLHSDTKKRWRIDGSIYEIVTDHAKLRIRLLSETGKINVNNADLATLQRLFSRSNGTEAQLATFTINRAAAILDWRDSDDLVRINGAERKQYTEAHLPYTPSNQNLQTLAELDMILGMDEQTLTWLKPLVTIYGQHSEVDLRLASKDVLQLFLGNLAHPYLQTRLQAVKQNLPSPTAPIHSASAGLSQTSILDAITIVSEVQSNDRGLAVIHTVLQKTSNQRMPFQILTWQRYDSSQPSLFANTMNELVIKRYAASEFND